MNLMRKAKQMRQSQKDALLNGEVITVGTKSMRFTTAHEAARETREAVGDYFVALSHYLKLIKIAKPEPVVAIEEPKQAKADESIPLLLHTLIGAKEEIEFGTKNTVLKVTGLKEWQGGENKRIYIQLDCEKCTPIYSAYLIVSGISRDNVIEIGKWRFGFVYGNCNSGSKRDEARRALKALLSNLL